jgi:hypothetical protein
MPDSVTSTSVSWFPVFTLLLGYITKSISDWLQHQRTGEREREAREAARREQLFERRSTFQRQTLLDLQEALMQLARTIGEMNSRDNVTYRDTGKWQRQLYGADLAEGNRLANARTAMLGVRVRDDSVRDLLQQFKDHCTAVTMSASQADCERSLRSMSAVFVTLNQRIGEVLGKLDDDADQAASAR